MRTALVTGGARGIGLHIVQALEDDGYHVYYTTRDEPETPYGIQTEYDDLASLPDCDILVNNAGSTLGVQDPHCSLEDLRRVMWLNFELPVQLCNRMLPRMRSRGWGRIVNISSCSGLEQRGPVTFTCAKAALTAYTRSMGLLLAKEAPGIVMTAVFPGVVFTDGGHWDKVQKERPEHAERYIRDQVPVGRFGRPEEIAPLVAFLCGEHASFMHGSLVSADGGLSKHFWNQVAA